MALIFLVDWWRCRERERWWYQYQSQYTEHNTRACTGLLSRQSISPLSVTSITGNLEHFKWIFPSWLLEESTYICPLFFISKSIPCDQPETHTKEKLYSEKCSAEKGTADWLRLLWIRIVTIKKYCSAADYEIDLKYFWCTVVTYYSLWRILIFESKNFKYFSTLYIYMTKRNIKPKFE